MFGGGKKAAGTTPFGPDATGIVTRGDEAVGDGM
jgi:hypothetical protein